MWSYVELCGVMCGVMWSYVGPGCETVRGPGDPEQQYFADGIAEDLTTDLSRISDMFVISRNVAEIGKGQHNDRQPRGAAGWE